MSITRSFPIAALVCALTLVASEASATSSSDRARAPRAGSHVPSVHQVSMAGYSLAPLGHVRFCLEYPEQCKTKRPSLRKAKVSAHPERIAQLVAINARINREIRPQPDRPGVMNDIWTIGPKRGDCDDFAVTKRAALQAAGWPSRALLLATAWLPDGQAHLVLIARTTGGDFVLDNLARDVRPVVNAAYHWNSIQDENNPKFWRRVQPTQQLVAFAPRLIPKQAPAESRPGIRMAAPRQASREVQQLAMNWTLRLHSDVVAQ